jgi:23S rRNA (uracil1939-C5)-methyltransferase
MNAPDEERVVCEHAQRCGGCPLIGLSYPDQLAQKRARVQGAALRYPSLESLHIDPVAPAHPVVGYRTRAKLIVGPDGDLGLFAKGGGHQVVDIPRCRVLSPSLARMATILRGNIAAARAAGGALAPFDSSGRGGLRAIDLREVREGDAVHVLVTFVVQRDRASSIGALEHAARELMRSAPEVSGVACNFHDGDAPQVLGRETVPLAGVTSARDRVGGSVHLATFGSFVQAHRGQAGHVHAWLADALGLSDSTGRAALRVLDLYGGSGSIALGLASAGASVRLIDSFAPAVAHARAAAQAQGIALETACADVTDALRAMAHEGERFDAIVVNPPRRGTSPAVRESLARLEPRTLAYVSCDPETLARDLDHLARLGYRAISLRPLDMIPLTDEVETVAVLQRAEIPWPRALYEEPEVIAVDKGPHEPMTPQGEYRGSLLARMRRRAGAESAVPVHHLDVGTSGLAMFVRDRRYVAKWERVLSSASTRKVYVAAVRGVTPPKGEISRGLRDRDRLDVGRTRYRRLAIAAGHSLLRIVVERGKTYPIRRHLAAIGHPVLGDDRYGHAMTNRFFAEKGGLDRTFLHCFCLEFDHPDTGARHILQAPLPGDLRVVLERMGHPHPPGSATRRTTLAALSAGAVRSR